MEPVEEPPIFESVVTVQGSGRVEVNERRQRGGGDDDKVESRSIPKKERYDWWYAMAWDVGERTVEGRDKTRRRNICLAKIL